MLGLSSCTGDVTMRTNDVVTEGDALGFDYIHYIATRPASPVDFQDLLEIDTNGVATFESGRVDSPADSTYPTRFLLDEELLELRKLFFTSNFAAWDSSQFGDPTSPIKQTIVYQVDGRYSQVARRGGAPVPETLLPLFQAMETLAEASRQVGEGEPFAVEVLFEGQSSAVDRRDFAIVSSDDELIDLLWRIGSNEITVLPRLDFEREMLVGVFLGRDVGTTDRVTFTAAGYRSGTGANLLFRRSGLPREGAEGGLSPFVLAKIPRVRGRIEFFELPQREFRLRPR